MLKQHDNAVQLGKIGFIDVLAARETVSLPQETDTFIESQLKRDGPDVQKTLSHLASTYGSENLKNLTDREVYNLYKNHAAANK